jgi:hypothetical protein
MPNAPPFSDLWSTIPPAGLPLTVWNTIALAILWKIWDTRNAKVFRHIDQTPQTTVTKILSDLTPPKASKRWSI